MEFKQHERISARHLTGETIRIGDDWAASVVRCRLDECHIVIDVPRGGPGIYDSRLTNCTIEAKRRLKDSQGFMHASYIQCKFLGKFAGMDFGRSFWFRLIGEWPPCAWSTAGRESWLATFDYQRIRALP